MSSTSPSSNLLNSNSPNSTHPNSHLPNSHLPNKPPVDEQWHKRMFTILFSNMSCLFDFVIFVHFSKILTATFFPKDASSLVEQLQTFLLFSVGFLSRPIGALLIGRYGDVHGRTPALSISLTLFTLTTLLMACLPTYTQVGILAPILFIILRLMQGMAFGAQLPLGWVFTAEYAPRDKFAMYNTLVTASFALGNIMAFIVATVLLNTLSQDILVSQGWRIPFVIGGVLSLVSLILNRSLTETPLFVKYRNQSKQKPKFRNIMPAFKRGQAIVLAAVLSFTLVSLATLVIIMPKLIAAKFNLSGHFLTIAYLTIITFAMFGLIFYGWLADKYSIGKVMVGGAMALMLHTLIFYIFLSSSSLYYILPMCALLGFLSGIRGLPAVIIVQLFPTEVRLMSVAVIYNSVSAVIGIALPIALLYSTNIIRVAPGLFITGICLIMMMTGLLVQSSPGLNKFENLVDAGHGYIKA